MSVTDPVVRLSHLDALESEAIHIMIAGFDRYFQIAPCFRDEDARADRSPGEFYQLDLEMSFVTQQDVFDAVEPVIRGVFEEFSNGKPVTPKFPLIPYADALRKYGTDKPDLRNPVVMQDVSEAFRGSGFKIFANILNADPTAQVWAIPAPKGGNRAFCDRMYRRHRRTRAVKRSNNDAYRLAVVPDDREFSGLVMCEACLHFLFRLRQRDPHLQPVNRFVIHTAFRPRALGVHDAATRGHPVHFARSDRNRGAQAVTVHDFAVKQVGYGGKSDVRMRPHVETIARAKFSRPEMIEKDEWPHHGGTIACRSNAACAKFCEKCRVDRRSRLALILLSSDGSSYAASKRTDVSNDVPQASHCQRWRTRQPSTHSDHSGM